VLREAGEWSASILGGEQDAIAQHFARSVPPLVLWDGIPVRDDDPRLIADAVGWLQVRTIQEVVTGDHTLFVGEVIELERGPATTSLVYLDRRYWPL
jgi:flavin reductase (DIM6/NTAB) family NADH-FMN oxidoreductase RutF